MNSQVKKNLFMFFAVLFGFAFTVNAYIDFFNQLLFSALFLVALRLV
jgi:hypothetical protein